MDPAYDNSPAGVRYAAAIGADYVVFDVRRAGDGTLVCGHDPVDRAAQARATSRTCWPRWRKAGLGAHVDLKGPDVDGWAAELRERCADVLDETLVVYTTGDGHAAADLAAWTEDHDSPALVGLTMGSSTGRLRLRSTDAPGSASCTRPVSGGERRRVLVAHHVLARLRLLRWARRRGVRVLVWTADSPRVVAAALKEPRVWMLTRTARRRRSRCGAFSR